MKYFLHDTSSFDDEKVSELFIIFGYEGLGLFYTVLEKIARQEKPVKTDVLKSQLRIGKRLDKCWVFMEQIGLIQSINGETFNKELLNFSEKYQIKKEKNRKKISEWRERQEDAKNVTSYEPSGNAPKVKESKGKEYIYGDFESMYKRYNSYTSAKKDRKFAAEKYWNKTSDENKELAWLSVEIYAKEDVVKRGFAQLLRTYLSDRTYNDYKDDVNNRGMVISESEKFGISVETYEMRKGQWGRDDPTGKRTLEQYLKACEI